MHKFLRNASTIVATSPNYLATSKVLNLYRQKTKIIPIGLDKKIYPSLNKNKILFWKKRLKKQFFLFVGAMRYYKGLHILLEASMDNTLEVVIAGSGKMENLLKNKAKQLQLNNVHFITQVTNEDKVALLNLCYCFYFSITFKIRIIWCIFIRSCYVW